MEDNSSVLFGAYPPEVEERIKQVEANLSNGLRDTLKWSLDKRMYYYNMQGLSIAVVHNYEIEWAKGYGWADKADKRPVTPETLFQAASVSKSLNAVGVMKLVQENQLDLYSDINNFLTLWKFPYDSLAKNKKISIANLLSHTAGLGIHGFVGYKLQDTLPTIPQILDGKKPANTPPVRSEFEPGIKYQYSGGGVMISQQIVMETTKLPYEQYMQENVLNPMGMTSSFYNQPPPSDRLKSLATAYYQSTPLEGNYVIYPEQAAAGLWTTPTDLCKFIIEIQLSLQGKSNKVLSKETAQKMLTPYIDKVAALGVFIDNNGIAKYFMHSGANDGFRSLYYGSLEDGNGVAMMVNSYNSNIMYELLNSVLNVYQWKGYYKPTEITEFPIEKVNPIVPNPATDFIELIEDIGNGRIEIFNSIGVRIMNFDKTNKIDVSMLSDGLYFLRAGDKVYSFIKK